MSNGIEFSGFDDLANMLEDMTLTEQDERKAIKKGIEYLAKNLEEDSPKGKRKKLSKVKTSIKREGMSLSGNIKAGSYYGMFQEYGTSKQKANVGYFEKSIEKSKDEALELVAEEILKNIK